MTDIERLKALRRDISQRDAFRRRNMAKRTEPQFWLLNALCFDWHGEPCYTAMMSWRYGQRLSRG
jgi:hypothetical protein